MSLEATNSDVSESNLAKTSQIRKITRSDAKEVSRLIATRKLTETESCILLGIKPKAWFNWKLKGKNSKEFEDLITKLRSLKLDALLTNIENVGNGIGVKQRDWRASAWMAERVIAADRLNPKPEVVPNAPVVNVAIMSDVLKRIFSVQDAPQSTLIEVLAKSTTEETKCPESAAKPVRLPIRKTLSVE